MRAAAPSEVSARRNAGAGSALRAGQGKRRRQVGRETVTKSSAKTAANMQRRASSASGAAARKPAAKTSKTSRQSSADPVPAPGGEQPYCALAKTAPRAATIPHDRTAADTPRQRQAAIRLLVSLYIAVFRPKHCRKRASLPGRRHGTFARGHPPGYERRRQVLAAVRAHERRGFALAAAPGDALAVIGCLTGAFVVS